MRKLVAMCLLLSLLLAACASDEKVGGEIDLSKIKEGQKGPRLGEAASPAPEAAPTAGKLDLGQSPAPKEQPPSPQPPPPPQQAPALEVALLAENPYYQLQGDQPGQLIRIPVGRRVRFVNRDETNRQPYVEGLFESPVLPPGGSFEFHATTRTGGQLELNDAAAPFKVGAFEIY